MNRLLVYLDPCETLTDKWETHFSVKPPLICTTGNYFCKCKATGASGRSVEEPLFSIC